MTIRNETAATPTATPNERRPLTVLFSDIVDSTAIAERMDPEDWTAIVNEAFDRMSRAIRRYDGTIARLMGDAILAFFGAPIAHEDDPERAIRAGLDLIASIEALSARVQREQGVPLRVRVGINTGPVLVGTVGTAMAREYTAMGDAVNVAARMQSAARPGTVLVTAATYAFVAPIVDASDAGALELKGKSEPVRAYEIAGIRAGGASSRGLAGIQSPMVGRDEQLAQLRSLFTIVRAGRGRVACVLGEPGIGKSRLLAELRADVMRDDAHAYLGHLLSITLEPEMAARLAGLEMEAVKRYVASIHQLLRAFSLRGPIVLVCEDLHWADPSSADAIGQLLPLANELPMLIIATSRLDRGAPGWHLVVQARDMFGDAFTELPLSPLSGEESRELVANLLAIESLPAAVRDFILDKAEGNPFFVEEVVRMLISRGAIERQGERWVATAKVDEVEIPDTLQGLLLARIDRLPDDARRALRVASVIGRQFPVSVLAQLLAPAAER